MPNKNPIEEEIILDIKKDDIVPKSLEEEVKLENILRRPVILGGILRAVKILLTEAGKIMAGQTDYNTGTGFFLGESGGQYKLSIGNPAGDSLTWDGSTLTVQGKVSGFNQDIFGDGNDGDVTIAADTSLSRDMYYNNLTIDSGITLSVNGWRIFVKDTLTNNGIISTKGGDGGNASLMTGGTAGVASASNSIKGGISGKVGATGQVGDSDGAAGTAGDDLPKGLVSNGAAGGEGGNSNNGGTRTGGAGGAAGSITGTIYNSIRNFWAAYGLIDVYPSLTQLGSSAGSGSGGAGAVATNVSSTGGSGGGGGSGASGGILSIFAKKLINNGTITSNGGNGGNGGNSEGTVDDHRGGGGGGAGGSGGVIILTYFELTNAGSFTVARGTGGIGGTAFDATSGAGANGSNGLAGKIIQLQI